MLTTFFRYFEEKRQIFNNFSLDFLKYSVFGQFCINIVGLRVYAIKGGPLKCAYLGIYTLNEFTETVNRGT